MKKQHGFTFIELMIVIAILGVLAAISLPIYSTYSIRSRVSEMLVAMSGVRSCVQEWNQDRMHLPSVGSVSVQSLTSLKYSSAAEWDGESIVVVADPDKLGAELTLRMVAQINTAKGDQIIVGWNCMVENSSMFDYVPDNCRNIYSGSGSGSGSSVNGYVLQNSDVIMGVGGHTGFIKGSYSGSAKDVITPRTMDGVTVTDIYQDVFKNTGLTTITFEKNSEVKRIHARAFQNNNLTEVTLPDSIKRIDYGAFAGNNIKKVTIGAGVTLESNVFQNSDKFKAAYLAQGAGTYVYRDGEWAKQ